MTAAPKPGPKFKIGDIVTIDSDPQRCPVVVATPDPFGSVVIVDYYYGGYLVLSQDRCQLVPSFPVGFANIYPTYIARSHPTRESADAIVVATRLGVYEYHADGTVTLHELDQ